MLHPVGPLPAAVYWRRRLLVLTLLVAVLGGGGWLAVALATGSGGSGGGTAAAASAEPTEAAPPPALEQVVPSLASVQTPTPATTPPPAAPDPVPAGPAPGGPCTDDMVGLEVRTPGSAPSGGKPTFELVVTNVSPVPCVRTLDKGLQEVVLVDGAGTRLWGSNDCFPEASSDTRTLAPGEQVAFPLVWGGLTSEPGCAGTREPVGPGQYAVRGRLDTKIGPDAPFAIT
ncbi:MucR family transcriptional regulator [Geodermatophilus sp. CPCC 206100]|uniref:MucR family transcriptional regulator n=1 Tax=Geodermatophilus sp. CPCC 206100 TaxID=3020054 RepID=UPI003AFF9DE8